MSELIVIRLREVEQLNPLQRSIAKEAADALEAQAKRITELEASLADSNEALQVMGLKLEQAEADPMPTMTAAFKDAGESVSKFYGPAMKTKLPWEDQSHSANTVGGPTPVMDAAPACEQ